VRDAQQGPYIEQSVAVLADVLGRMAEHHRKKNALLPSLHSWHADERPA
jgi:pyruvate kinase